jgi:hypothetical protein
MVIRSSAYPRLPSIYWGELIYATPGCGKTYVSNKYRDVVDGDDIIVQAISEVKPYWNIGYYSDPREVIFRFFRYIQFNRRVMWRVYSYNVALDKMNDACADGDVVLFGTVDLMDKADRIFLQKSGYYIRNGFNTDREEDEADDCTVPVHDIYEYLDNSMQRVCQGRY